MIPPVQKLVPCGSSYTLEIIQMAILFVLQAATSLRSCESCINLVYEMQQEDLPVPLLEQKLEWIDEHKQLLPQWQ